RLRVGIVDLERRADQIVGEVDLGTLEEVEADVIDENGGAVALDHEVVVQACVVDGEIVLESGTAAAGHRQPQHAGRGFRFQNLRDALGGACGNGHGQGGFDGHVPIM